MRMRFVSRLYAADEGEQKASLVHATKRMVAAKFYGDGTFDPQAFEGTKTLLQATGEIKGAFAIGRSR